MATTPPLPHTVWAAVQLAGTRCRPSVAEVGRRPQEEEERLCSLGDGKSACTNVTGTPGHSSATPGLPWGALFLALYCPGCQTVSVFPSTDYEVTSEPEVQLPVGVT